MEDPQIRERFSEALSGFVNRAKEDKRVLAIIVYGSMAYDELSERSNIDLYVIINEGQYRSTRLIEYGVPLDVQIYNKNEFMRRIHQTRGRGMQQLLSSSKLLFSRDRSFTNFYQGISRQVGHADQSFLQMFYLMVTRYDLQKAEKYLYIKQDIEHSYHFLIHGLSELGYLLCYINQVWPPREVVVKGKQLLPELYPKLYDELSSKKVSRESLDSALRMVYGYLDAIDLDIYKPILDFISENGGTASQTDIVSRFRSQGMIIFEIEHLHRRRILRRTVAPVKLTKKGAMEYNEPLYHFSWDSFDPSEVKATRVGPSKVDQGLVHADYQAALAELVSKAEADDYVLNLMVSGSLSYDTVWEKSDIDFMIVTRDEPYERHRIFVEKDVLIEGLVVTRDYFRKSIQGVRDGSIFHSYFSKSKLLVSKDDSIMDLYEDLGNMGSRDVEELLFLNYIYCKDLINKTYKALHVKHDPQLALNFIMPGIRRMANIEVLLNKQIPLRESTAQALALNPVFFRFIFSNLVQTPNKSPGIIDKVLGQMEGYLDRHLLEFAQPVLRLLEKNEEMTHYDLKSHFGDIWLPLDLGDFVDKQLIQQTEASFRFGKKSTAEMMQPAYQLETIEPLYDFM